MINPIAAIQSVSDLATSQSVSPVATPKTSFADWMTQQMNETQRLDQKAEAGLLNLATGQADNLHQVMIDLEQAKLSFQLLLQVRNRALEAYQEIMRMQI